MSTDCEALLKKFLALNPTKRYTLEQIMKDKWMNQNEEELKPYTEGSIEMNDPKLIDSLLTLGYKLSEIEKSLSSRRFDEICGIYLLLQNSNRKLSRSKPESMTSIASTITSAAPSSSTTMPSTHSVPSSTVNNNNNHHAKSETTTNGDGLKETSFMTMTLDENSKTAKHSNNDPPSPEPANLKRQHTIGPESLKERNAIRLHTVSNANPNLRPISATPKVAGERSLQKSPVKPLRAFKPETSLSITAQTPRRPNVNVYKKVDNTKDTTSLITPSSTVGNSSSSTSSNAFTRNGPSRYTFHSGQSRMAPRDHNTLGSKAEPSFGKGNFLQRLTTRFSKRFRLNGKHPAATTATNTTDNSNNSK